MVAKLHYCSKTKKKLN